MKPILPLLCSLVLAAPAWAGDFDDLEDEGDGTEEPEEEGEAPEGVDDEAIYADYKQELRGESAADELDAWRRYLEVYPQSQFRLEIEKRMKALEEAAYNELEEEKAVQSTVDAKDAEMDVLEPALLSQGANPRRHIEISGLWGYPDYINYELMVEWAFTRQFAAFGGVRHGGRGFGGTLQAGVKYAVLKDVRTGVVLTPGVSIHVGYNALDAVHFGIEPWLGFAFLPNSKFQLQTSISPYLRLDRFRFVFNWDIQIGIRPVNALAIYFESKQKHGVVSGQGIGRQYEGFHQAGVGVKIFPSKNLEFMIGANIPYALRIWKDYKYFGIHAGATIYIDRKPGQGGGGGMKAKKQKDEDDEEM